MTENNFFIKEISDYLNNDKYQKILVMNKYGLQLFLCDEITKEVISSIWISLSAFLKNSITDLEFHRVKEYSTFEDYLRTYKEHEIHEVQSFEQEYILNKFPEYFL